MPAWGPHWLRDTWVLLSSQLLVVVTTTLLAIMLARTLGPSDWGLFSALLAMSLALSTFVSLGLGTWLLRDLSQLEAQEEPETFQVESSRRVVGATLVNFVAGGLLLLITSVVLLVVGWDVDTSAALLALIGATVFSGAAGCLEAFLRAKRRLRTVVVATMLERFSLLGLAALAIVADYGIVAIGLAYLLGSAARFVYATRHVFVVIGLPVCVPRLGHLRRFVTSGLPFAFSTVGVNVVPRLDTVIVAAISVTAAGYFALGDRILGPAQIVPVVASSALFPFLARESGSTAARRITVGMLAIGSGAAVLGAVLAPFFVPVVFGDSYDAAIGVVQIMFFALPFVYASNPLLTHLYTTGRERHVFGASLSASLLGTAAIVVGQLAFGVTGAAVAYVGRQMLFTAALVAIAYLARGRLGPPIGTHASSVDVRTRPE